MIKMFKRVLCFLWFNHYAHVDGIEQGEGTDFRYTKHCECGKRIVKDDWTDDNTVLGHGTR